MAFATLPHIRIHYEEAGSPDGAPVLLLHGFPDSRDTWSSLVRSWDGPAVRFLTTDQRGYGQTEILDPDAMSGEIAALADDALQLMNTLGLGPSILIGHDWGARAAYALAALQPERVRAVIGLASEYVAYRNTGVLPPAQIRDYWYQWFFHTPLGEQTLGRDRKSLCGEMWRVWSPTWKWTSDELTAAAEAWENPQFVTTVLSYYRNRYGNAPGAPRYAAQASALANKPQIRVPTWFLTGLADACNHPEGSVGQEAWFTGSYQRVELEGIGHFIPREAPEAVAHALETALQATHRQG